MSFKMKLLRTARRMSKAKPVKQIGKGSALFGSGVAASFVGTALYDKRNKIKRLRRRR